MNPGHKPWSNVDLALLEMYYPTEPIEDVAGALERSVKSVRSKAKVLGIKSDSRYVWTKSDIAKLRRLYPNQTAEYCAKVIGCTVFQVRNRVDSLKLKKSSNWIAEELVRQIALLKGGKRHQYPKGHVPANKGLRRPGYAPGRMASTQFKKGQRSGAANSNYKPVGTITKDADGCLIVKVYDNPSYKKNEGIVGDGKPWEYMHRKLWREVKGPIPPKTHVAFIDGNKENIVIENLELVSFGEMCRRNSIHNLPADLKQVIQLNGALKRRLRRMENNGQEQNSGPAGPSVRDDRSVEGHGKSDGDSARPGDQRSRRDHNRLGARRGRTREGRRRKRDRQRVLLSS